MNAAPAKRAASEPKNTTAVHVRLDDRDAERLRAAAEQMNEESQTAVAREALSIGLEAIARVHDLAARVPALSRLGLAREALVLGLDAIERDTGGSGAYWSWGRDRDDWA